MHAKLMQYSMAALHTRQQRPQRRDRISLRLIGRRDLGKQGVDQRVFETGGRRSRGRDAELINQQLEETVRVRSDETDAVI
jgi:hypothetical protein